ncbi:MAG: cytochrome-c oxidase, cbb3-type subunit III [Halofilum sp. (in: g-proteobacteria)]|nr:cytochrome-c oxidase, cbb3-type subunit III [Halofilum sp. (in: g-proteobacteria)]
MSAFWTGWIIVLVAVNWLLVTFLLFYAARVKIPTADDGTTGHVWAHGAIREGVRRLPRWWIVLSVVLMVAATIYLFLYPAFGSLGGTLGWTSEGQVQRSIERNEQRRGELFAHVRNTPMAQLADDPRVVTTADVLYQDNCAACHGPAAQGADAIGAPNLADGAWLYGGDADTIHASLVQGRSGVMPAFGQGLGERGVREVAAYVYELNGRDWPRPDLVRAGEARYQAQCVACHGPEARGNPQLGAPDLTDDAWLYGGRMEQIETSIRAGRNGVMPAWSGRLHAEEIRMLTAWVLARGGATTTAEATTHE